MASGSAGAAHFAGTPPILPSLLAVPPPEPTLTYLLPMLGSLAAALAGVEANVAPCVEIRDVMERSVTPLLRVTSLPGLALLALGAGYGEEALFRGFLIPVASASALNSGFDGGVATALALGSSSVVFGALHAVTPLYFAWATAAGALFGMCLAAAVAPMLSGADHACLAGWEYLATGGELSACAATHALYDLIAFIAIARMWAAPPEAGARDEPRNDGA